MRFQQSGKENNRKCEICDGRMYTDEFEATTLRGGYRTALCNEHYTLWEDHYLENHPEYILLCEKLRQADVLGNEIVRIMNRLYHIARIWVRDQKPQEKETP